MNKVRLSAVNFIGKNWSKSFNNGTVYNRVGFKCICASFSRQFIRFFRKLFTGATESEGQWEKCTKTSQRKTSCFLTRNFQTRQNCIISNLVFTFPIRILSKPRTLSFKKETITTRSVLQLNCLEEPKKLEFTMQLKDMVLHFLVWTWENSSELMLAMKWRSVER